jgi:hypothetical protein
MAGVGLPCLLDNFLTVYVNQILVFFKIDFNFNIFKFHLESELVLLGLRLPIPAYSFSCVPTDS